MSRLSFGPYKGIKSEISPKLLPDGFAVESTNCFLDSGALDNWGGLEHILVLGKSGTIQTLHLIANETWMHWNEAISCALAPIANNDIFYTVLTGYLDGFTRYTDKNLAKTGGGISWPNSVFYLGFPQPSTTLLATVEEALPDGMQFQWTIAGTEEDSIGNKLTYSYVYTYVDSDGREGPPSLPSDLVYASTDDKITLTNFDQITGVPGSYNPSGATMRIYRSQEGSLFLFMKSIVTGTTFWTDDFSIAPGAPIESTTWSAPPENMLGVVVMANGIMAGYVNNDVYLSEPYQPHAWPEDYILHTDYPITGLVSIGNMLIVSTEKYPYITNITHPSTATLNKLETIQGNINLRSMVEIDGGAIYASNDGLVAITSTGSALLSKDIISEKTWKEMIPSSIHGYFYREKYLGFYNAGSGTIETDNGEVIPAQGCFILDAVRGYVSYIDIYASAAYSDLNTSELYIVQNIDSVNNVLKFNADFVNPLSKTWESKPLIVDPVCYTAARAEWKSGTITVKIYANKVLRHTEVITDSTIFRLPSGYTAKEWSIRVTGTGVIDGFFLSTSASELL